MFPKKSILIKKYEVVIQATNKIEHWEIIDGKKKKAIVSQSELKKENGNEKNGSVKRKIHKDTLYGRTKLYQFKAEVSVEDGVENESLIVNLNLRGYYGSNRARQNGFRVPGKTVQMMPFFWIEFLSMNFQLFITVRMVPF